MIDSLSKLALKHDYYCSDNNYYDSQCKGHYDTWKEFYDEFKDADIDMNLVFRWDVHEDDGHYYAMVFMMHQRKGIFTPHWIKRIEQDDVDSFKKFMRMHWEKLESIWRPLNYPSWMSEFEASTDERTFLFG